MFDDELKVVTAITLYSLFSSGKVSTPTPSLELLTRVIASKPPTSLVQTSSPVPRFRLTDISRFEAILEDLSKTWDYGTLSLSRENGELIVMDVALDAAALGFAGPTDLGLGQGFNSRKRKRVVDEEADSAAGDDDAEDPSFEDFTASRASSTLGRLGKELREVYAILQKSTAKGRLLAEQVVQIPSHLWENAELHISTNHSKKPSSPSAPTSPKMTVQSRDVSTTSLLPRLPPLPPASATKSTSGLSSAHTQTLRSGTAPI